MSTLPMAAEKKDDLRKISDAELAQHNSTESSLWLAINGTVFDVTSFQKVHPGGAAVLLMYGGKDATEAFFGLHTTETWRKYRGRMKKVGLLETGSSEAPKVIEDEPLVSEVPYAEMPLLNKAWHKSPWFKDSHEQFFLDMRKFARDSIQKEALEVDYEDGKPSEDILKKTANFGILACLNGKVAVNFLESINKLPQLPGGLKCAKDFDFFHEMIAMDLWARELPSGYRDGLCGGMQISLPAILQFGTERVRNEIGLAILQGDKRSCLAISEPQAGSDVANIVTKAVKSDCGKFYIVSGVKKWITGGMFADYFVTAVRTKESKKGKGALSGMKGISLLLIPRGEGVRTTQVLFTVEYTQYW